MHEQVDTVYAINQCSEELCDYISKVRYTLPADGKPYAIPRKMALQYLKHHALKIIDNIDEYCHNNPDVKLTHLVIRDGGIGDLILLAPVLEQYKKENPSIRLSIACDENNISVCQAMPYIDEVLPINEKTLRSHIWITDLRTYSELDESRKTKHRTDVYAQKFKLTKFENKEPHLVINKWQHPYMSKTMPNIVVQGGTSHSYRDWPHTKECILQLADFTNVIVMDYRYRFDLPAHKNIQDMRNRTDVAEMMSCISQADLCISPDSGGMHIALAAGVPTICMFGIIRPDYRLRYYTAPVKAFDYGSTCGTPHCGENHMMSCNAAPGGEYAKCMSEITVREVTEAAFELLDIDNAGTRLATNERVYAVKSDTVTKETPPAGRLTLCCISQNEAKLAPVFIERVMKHPLIGRTIIIDGGSTDGSDEMFRDAGAEVYYHPYNKEYHDMQAMQRNISCSYLHYGERALIMDMDECFSNALIQNLHFFLTTPHRYVEIPRRTYFTLKDALNGCGQIKDYPDYQPRFFIWDHKYKWIRSPHHVIVNAPEPYRVQWDILHYEAEGKDRAALEEKWKNMQHKTNEYYRENK